MDYVELELGLHRREANAYSVELRLSEPNNDSDVRLTRNTLPVVEINLEELHALSADDEEYGKRLMEKFLGDNDVENVFVQARAIVQTLDAPFRVRLFIGPTAPELHDLRWETILSPLTDSPLSKRVWFSRYISSLDARPLRLRPRSALRALAVVANPKDLSRQKPGGRELAPINVDAEMSNVRARLRRIPITFLASADQETLKDTVADKPTLRHTIAKLRDGYDILYLVCHGALIGGEPMLWFEDDERNIANVAGRDLVAHLRDLREPPRLVFLASCQSAGKGDDARSDDGGALAGLGPRLAEAGIPAVIAMQGNVTMMTQTLFAATLFEELEKQGQIDAAAAIARVSIIEQDDWWMPVLFMRLKSGRVWSTPSYFEEFEKWPSLLNNIRDGKCTPILGSGLTDALVGSRKELAQKLAEEYYYPMADHEREDLPQVAQFLAIEQNDASFAARGYLQFTCRAILDRYGDDVPPELRGLSPEEASRDEIIEAYDKLLEYAWRRRCEVDTGEPHLALAKLPFRMYITTNPDNLLTKALSESLTGEHKKQPRVEVCDWNSDVNPLPSIQDTEPNYRPSKESPLVYHLFGRIEPQENLDGSEGDSSDFMNSLVLTEDNYFDFLIGATENKEQIPPAVRRAFSDNSILFLGFQLEDWNFRILYRSIMRRQGSKKGANIPHVAVQLDPEEWRVQEPKRARRFLKSYFKNPEVSIYWGSVDDFVKELLRNYYRK